MTTVVPHVNDRVLLAAGIWLVFGLRVVAWLTALAALGYIVAVALTRSPSL